jgi:glutaminyl-tRNA synthetase
VVGLRRRGYTPEAIQLLCERTGVSKSNSWIEYSVLEGALRDDLESKAPRAMAVLDPLLLKLTNWAQIMGSDGHLEPCQAPALPHGEESGTDLTIRSFNLSPELWIERDDFMEVPAKGYHRLYVGGRVRLKYGYVIECTGCEKDADGKITAVLATLVPDTKSGTAGAAAVKVKGVITWVSAAEAVPAQFRLYERLFNDPQPDAGGKDFLAALNPDSLRVSEGWVEPGLSGLNVVTRLQFERHGYFVTDCRDSRPDALVFNRVATLRDSWGK